MLAWLDSRRARFGGFAVGLWRWEHSRELPQTHHGGGEREALALLQKGQHVAAGFAAEAVPQAFGGRDRKRGLAVIVERAAREQALTYLAQLEPAGAEDLDEIHAGFELVEIRAGKVVHEKPLKNIASICNACLKLAFNHPSIKCDL